MQLPRKMVLTACHQFMPRSMSDEASMYVGTQADMLIQSTARSRAVHLRRSGGTGATSGLMYAEVATSGGSVLASPGDASAAARVAGGCSFIVRPWSQRTKPLPLTPSPRRGGEPDCSSPSLHCALNSRLELV